MKILLDENFPLQLYRHLRMSGYDVEHIIVLGQRGIPDSAIRDRLSKEELLFITQDAEFERMPAGYRGTILISRVKQGIPIQKRTEIWLSPIVKFVTGEKQPGQVFALLEGGEVATWDSDNSE